MAEHSPHYCKVKGLRPPAASGTESEKEQRKDTYPIIQRSRQGILKGEVSQCTIDLLFDWFGLVCFANKNKNIQLSYS